MSFIKEIKGFYARIDELDVSSKPLFGQMNANQMVCHCADFFRLALGYKKAEEYGVVDPKEIIALSRSEKTAPTPKGFGQIEGNGTVPTDFGNDKMILKEFILEFSKFNGDFEEHPYFGIMDRERWRELAIYHLNHHLKQFGV